MQHNPEQDPSIRLYFCKAESIYLFVQVVTGFRGLSPGETFVCGVTGFRSTSGGDLNSNGLTANLKAKKSSISPIS